MAANPMDDDQQLFAAVALVGHAGAKQLEVGYLHDDVPVEEAGWWAKAQYQGARITVEDKANPVEAVEALARRLLTSAKCTWCSGLITLSPAGAVVYPGQQMADGTTLPEEPEQLKAMGQCWWQRRGSRWEPGCVHGQSSAPGAPKDRAARRRLRRDYEASRPKEASNG